MISRPDETPGRPSAWGHHLGTLVLAGFMFIWTWAYAPGPMVIVAVPGLIAWLMIIERSESSKGALGWTLLIGGALIGYGYSWLAQTIQDFGNLPAGVAWALTVLFGAAGILHGWIFIVIYRAMLRRGRRPHPMIVAALMVACEHLPIRFFPWKVGHGAVDCPPLVQAAEWGGVSAVSFVLMCLIVPIHEWMVWAFGRRGPAARPKAALVTFVIGCAFFGFGQLRYTQVRDDEAAAKATLRVGIVQPNVGSKTKREAERQPPGQARLLSIQAYERGSRKAAAAGAELIVWPETAIVDSTPIMLPKHDAHRTNGSLNQRGYRFVNELGEDHAFLLGIYEEKPGRAKISGAKFDERYNAAGLRQRGGLSAPWSIYRKVYLIPFGEYLPVPFLDPKDYLPQQFTMKPGTTEGESAEFSSVLTYETVSKQRLTLAPFLCYESILPEYVRTVTAGARPDILVSLTNDSWFGDTWEPHQHLNFTRFRAVEHRTPLVRATNTGISAFVSATGDVADGDKLGVGVEGVLVRDVKLVDRGPTIYVRFGYWFPWLMGILTLLALFASLLRPASAETTGV